MRSLLLNLMSFQEINNWKKTFSIIWSGQLFSTLSSAIVGYAVVFWLSLQTGSASVLAYAMIATLLPHIVFGLFTGVFVDRWNRKITMIAADSFIAFCTLALCLMFYFDTVQVWQIYILLALRSVGSAFHVPSMQASIPLLAPESELMRIAGINQIIQAISNIAGPALAALAISVMEMPYVLLFDIGGAIIACTTLLFVTIPNPKKKVEERHIFREIKEGISAIFEQRGLGWVLLFDVLVLFFIIPISALFPLMTTKYFLGETFEMSIVEIAWGIGSLLGGFIIGLKAMNSMNKIIIIIFLNLLIGLTFLISGLLPQTAFIWFVILTGLGGIAGAVWNGAFIVILQTKIDNAKLGRVLSTYDSLILLPSIPGLLATGYIAEHVGLTQAFIISGLIICLLSFLVFLIPSVRDLGRQDPKK